MLKIDWRNCVLPGAKRVFNARKNYTRRAAIPLTSKTGVGKIHICEDTSYIYVRGRVLSSPAGADGEFETAVKTAKELAKGSKEGQWPAVINGQAVTIWAKGASRWFPYVVEINGTRLLWSGKTIEVDGKYNFEIQLGSATLWRLGGLGEAWAAMLALFSVFGIIVEVDLLSRNDVANDVKGVHVEQFGARVLSGRCVRRARRCVPRWKTAKAGDEMRRADRAGDVVPDESFVPIFNGMRLETLTVGSDLQVIMYDKIAELKRDKIKEALFREIWGPGVEVVTRVEFKMKRDFLEECGVRSVADYLGHRQNIMAYLARHWFRITEDIVEKNHTIRARMWGVWSEIVEALEVQFGKPREQIVRVHSQTIDTDQMDKQILGCLATVVAWKAGRDLTEAEAAETLSGEVMRLFSGVHWQDFNARASKAIAKARKTLGIA
jgi:hypothetical protein